MDSITIRRHIGPKHDIVGRLIEPATVEDRLITRCLIAPTRNQDLTTESRDGEVLSWDVFVSRRTIDVRRGDQVLIRGEWFTVTQVPFDWVPARRRSANHGTRFTCTRQEG